MKRLNSVKINLQIPFPFARIPFPIARKSEVSTIFLFLCWTLFLLQVHKKKKVGGKRESGSGMPE